MRYSFENSSGLGSDLCGSKSSLELLLDVCASGSETELLHLI